MGGIPNWHCGTALGTCLSSALWRPHRDDMQAVGALLLIAALLLVVVIVLLVLSIFKEFGWLQIVIAVVTGIAGLFSLAGMLVYLSNITGLWSPFLGTIGMTLSIQL